jgi:Ca-activated chloride channel family protein
MSFEWSGPAAEKDRIYIAPLDMVENKYWINNNHNASDGSPAILVAPALPGAYEVRYYISANRSVAFKKALEVTDAEVRISAPGEVPAGETISFEWKGPAAEKDRIFIAPLDLAENKYMIFDTHNTSDGSPAKLVAPELPGLYEIRYYSGANGLPLVRYPIRVMPHAVSVDAPGT